jgi:glyoxylase-like metal-dependent hydrolase (beta-lactamase superfamily II)
MSLTRLDCGTPQAPIPVNERFSDTFSYGDLKIQFVFSCYLIKHGDQYLLWDTGHSMTAPNVAPKVSIIDQLDKIGVKPEQITYVGISHYHADHTGQVASFPKATLLIGLGDWNAITAPKPAAGVNFAPFEGWIKGDNKVEPQPNDKDVFGDGSVIMLNTPGHTPGHHSLLVKLPQMGNVVISGDAVHFRENYDNNGRAVVQLRSLANTGFDRTVEGDRGDFQGHADHPARRPRHRQIAGVSDGGEIIGAAYDRTPRHAQPMSFRGNSGHRAEAVECPLLIQSGH